jgi:DNA-binding IclR family transcriptional regulator
MNRSIERNDAPSPRGKAASSPVLKAAALLRYVAQAGEPVALARLATALVVPKPTAHRLARLLEQAGLLGRDVLTRRYGVGPLLIDVAFDALRSSPGHSTRQLILARLSEKLGETVNFGILLGTELMYLDRVESSWPLRMTFKPGSRVPLHCTANGKLLLAWAPPVLLQRLLAGVPLTRFTASTITSRARLLRELAQIRRRDYAEDEEEFLAGVSCLAVPVRNGHGRVVAGLAVSAPSARFNLERARAHLADLRTAAEAIGRDMQERTPQGMTG